jgi:hypothetical protein
VVVGGNIEERADARNYPLQLAAEFYARALIVT